jgi:hypothetical protein
METRKANVLFSLRFTEIAERKWSFMLPGKRYELFILCVVNIVALTFTPLTGACGQSASALRHDVDSRLSKKVSIVGGRMFVGELLEKLSQQTGVTITASDKDGADGERIAVYLKDTPLFDALDSLWALLSYRKAEWAWEVTGDKPERYAYRLVRPLAARNLSVKVQEEIQRDFERHASMMLQGIHLKPEERKQLAKREPETAQLEGERLRSGLAAFEETLSESDQLSVLRHKKPLEVPMESLSAEAQKFVGSVAASMQGYTGGKDGALIPIPPPKTITFKVDRFSGDLSPTLIIDLDGFGGFGYLGGDPLNNQWKAKVQDRWMLPGDSRTDSSESKEIAKLSPAPERGENVGQDRLFPLLRSLAKASPLSFLACLPPDQRAPGEPTSRTVGTAIAGLEELSPPLQHKWRSGVLLLTYPGKIIEDVPVRIPWQVVKRLRQARDADPQGLLSLQDFLDAARGVTSAQWSDLGRDVEFAPMAEAANWHDFFLWINRGADRAEQIVTADGVPISATSSLLQKRAASDPAIASILNENKAARLRLEVSELPNSHPAGKSEPARRMFLFAFLSLEGKRIYATGFFWEGKIVKNDKAGQTSVYSEGIPISSRRRLNSSRHAKESMSLSQRMSASSRLSE